MSDIVLLGHPVAHSRSPVFQNAALAAIGSPWTYGVRDVDEAGVHAAIDAIRRGALVGANVTAPHKAVAFAAADRPTPGAAALGVANTLWCVDGEVYADNTDVAGVAAMRDALGAAGAHHAVVIGAGGAARAAVIAMGATASRVTVVNRTRSRADALVAALADHTAAALDAVDLADRAALRSAGVVVQATSVRDADPGRWRDAFDAMPDLVAALDLVYGAAPTGFVAEAIARGVRAADGALMLVEQGAASFERWTGRTAPRDVMYDALGAALGRAPGWASPTAGSAEASAGRAALGE